MKAYYAMVALATGLMAVMQVESKTVAWYRFDDEPAGTRTTGDTVIRNVVDPDKAPGRAYVRTQCGWSGKVQSALGYSPATLMPEYSASPNPAFRIVDLFSGEVYDNRSSLLLPCEDTASYYGTDGVFKIVDDGTLRLDSLTIEFFVKFPEVDYGATVARQVLTATSNGELLYSIQLRGTYLVYSLFTYVDDPTTGEKVRKTYSGDRSATVVKDGKWHHVAFVVSGGIVRLFVDYDATGKGTLTYEGNLAYGDDLSLTFGGDETTYLSGAMRYIDEVRVTDGALTANQLLTMRPLGGSTPLVESDTLLLVDFEGGTEPVSYSEDFPTTYTVVPAYQNKARPSDSTWATAVAEEYIRSGTTSGKVITNAAPVRFLSEVASATERSGLASGVEVANTTSCNTVTNSPSNDYVASVVLPAAISTEKLFEDSVTIEVSFRLPKYPNYSTGQLGWGTGSGAIAYFGQYCGFRVFSGGDGSWDRGYLQCSVGTTTLTGVEWSGGATVVPSNSADGKWHHLAIVYDKTAAHADFYLDGVRRLWGDNIAFSSDWKTSRYYGNRLMLGGNFAGDYNGACCADIAYDDLRITRGVLKPYQFLTTRAAADGTLARAAYDDGFALGPYADFFPVAVPAVFVDGGSEPATVSSVPARKIYDGENGSLIRSRNSGSVSFSGGMLTYPSNDLVCDQSEVTVEFFVRSSAATAGAGLVRLNRASATEPSAVSWALSFADAEGGLSVAIDTDRQVGAAHSFGGVLADDKWHHVAVTFAASGPDTLVTAYEDWSPIGSHVFEGRMMSRFQSSNLMLGAGAQGVAFNGCVDELRITPGILPPEKFLWIEKKGLVILLR